MLLKSLRCLLFSIHPPTPPHAFTLIHVLAKYMHWPQFLSLLCLSVSLSRSFARLIYFVQGCNAVNYDILRIVVVVVVDVCVCVCVCMLLMSLCATLPRRRVRR